MWNSLILILRNIIEDTVVPYTYSDERLKQAISVAAQLLFTECTFDYTYTIDFTTPDITPDPFTNDDVGFIGLVTMKAAILIVGGEYKMSTKNAIVVNDAWSSINLSGQASAYKILYDSFNKQYNDILMQHKFGNRSALHAILSPYTVANTKVTHTFY
jgi:hypothetical protein